MALRILLVVDSYFPGTGGTERQLAQLAPRFAASGHHVEILCPRLLDSMPIREVISGVLVRRINYPRIPKLGAFIMLTRFALALLRDYRNFDVIHVHIVRNIAPLIGALRPLLRGMLIAKISGATEMSGGLLDPKHSRTIRSRMRNYLLRRFDYIQAISTHTRAALLDAGYDEAKLIGIPNGVNTARFCAAKDEVQPSGKFHAIYAGRLAHVKGVDILLQAWARVVVLYPARLTILGEGQEFESLRNLATDLKIAGCVDFIGDCDDIAPYLAKADVYIQPSRNEGLPNAVIEAMAAGLPIVASSVGGNKDLVIDGSTGLLVKPESTEELALAVCSLFSDRVLIRRMGDLACGRAVEQYSIENVVSRLLSLYSGHTGAAATS
jgi:glycosyltransferase involved in cell wall biosynthesis